MRALIDTCVPEWTALLQGIQKIIKIHLFLFFHLKNLLRNLPKKIMNNKILVLMGEDLKFIEIVLRCEFFVFEVVV